MPAPVQKVVAKHAEFLVAHLTEMSEGEVDMRVRQLRAADILPVGRGRHAPELDSAGFAWILLSIISRRAVDAARIAVVAAKLRPIGFENYFGKTTLLDLLACLIDSENDAVRLTIYHDGTLAWLTRIRADGTLEELLWGTTALAKAVERHPDTLTNVGSRLVGPSTVIGANQAAQSWLELHDDEDEDAPWSPEVTL